MNHMMPLGFSRKNKIMPIITLGGEKYRYLEVGETIEKGDMLVPDDDENTTPGYLTVWEHLIGQDYNMDLEPVVRKV